MKSVDELISENPNLTVGISILIRGLIESENGYKYLSIWDNHRKLDALNKDDETTVLTTIMQEVEKATNKFPTWPTDPLHALAVLGEEFGELTKEVLQLTYEPHKTNVDNLKTEAIQTAAMAIRFCQSLNDYEFAGSNQHEQKGFQ